MCQLVWSQDLQNANQAGKIPPFFCRCKSGKHNRWDLVRYEVEQENRMISDRNTKGSHSCILAIRLCDFNLPQESVYVLGEDVQMNLIGPVVLLRYPVPSVNGKPRANTFIPNKIREALAIAEHEKLLSTQKAELNAFMATNADEDAKLQAVLEYGSIHIDMPSFLKGFPHPSTSVAKTRFAGFINYNGEYMSWADSKPLRPPPPDNWQCMRCYNYFEDLHYAEDCPSQKHPEWVPMNKRMRPVGRPKTTLRAVDMSNFTEVATAPYVDDHGFLWINK